MHLDSFYPQSLREEELKNKVAADWFGPFDCTRIIGNIDFCVDIPATELAFGYESEPALWAEAKAGTKKDIVASFVQLILTIGGEHTADRNLPPHFLGAFNAPSVNHWIPFTEAEVGAKDSFKSHFMSDLLNGKGTQSPNPENPVNPVGKNSAVSAPLRLCVKENISPAASAVLDAGRELWRYYHEQPDANPNASYYDIRLHFQGATTDAHEKSKMNPTSNDATYNKLLTNLRAAMKSLAANIEPKVYEYGFLLR